VTAGEVVAVALLTCVGLTLLLCCVAPMLQEVMDDR
jgi:hypothetical protein